MRTTSLLTAIIGLGLAGCAAEEDTPRFPPLSQLSPGINVIEADPAQGVLGAYRSGDDVVYFETRVGFLKPAVMREEFPDEPAAEIDLRFVDQNGLTFIAQRGGDQFVDPSWNESIRATFNTPTEPADRERDFVLARAAAQAFPDVAAPVLAAHTFHLSAQAARPLPSEDPLTIDRPDIASATISGSGCWDLRAGMSHSSVAIFGTHGSIQLWAGPCGDPYWYFQLNMCNHGSCTGSHQCYTYGWGLNDPSIDYEGSTSTGTVSGGCATSYYWDGGWGYHNSNDDTAYELWQAKEGRPATSRGDRWSFSWDAPNKHYQCDGNNGRWTAPSACP